MDFLLVLIFPYVAKNQRFTLVSGRMQAYKDQKKARVLAYFTERIAVTLLLGNITFAV